MSNRIQLSLLLGSGLLAIIISSWALVPSQFFRVHDFTHAARISEMALNLQQGQWPPYWVQNLGYGYGMPLFEFYAPLPYLVGSLIYLVTQKVVLSIQILFFLANILTLTGMYFFARRWFDSWGSMLIALLYTLAPYRALNIFIRGALSEVWGMAFLPWVFLGLDQLVRPDHLKPPKLKLNYLFTFSFAALLLSHNLSATMALPFLGIYGLVWWLKQWKLEGLKTAIIGAANVILSGLLSLGLTCFYWLPALMEKHLTKVDAYILGGYFDFHLHFLYLREFILPRWKYGGSGWGPDKDISFFLGYGLLLAGFLLVMGVCLYVWKNRWIFNFAHLKSVKKIILLFSHSEKTQVVFLFLVLSFCAIWLTLFKTQWLWEMIEPWKYIQFPWRWLGMGSFLLSLFMGGGLVLLFKSQFKYVFMLLVLAQLFHLKFFAPEKFLDNAADFYYTDPVKIRTEMSNILPDYIPRDLSPTLAPATKLVVTPVNDYSINLERSHEKLIKFNLGESTLVEFALANFPGWAAEIDGQPVEIVQSEQGTIQVQVPAGEHLVGIRLGSTPVRSVAIFVTVVSLVLWMSLTLNFRKLHAR